VGIEFPYVAIPAVWIPSRLRVPSRSPRLRTSPLLRLDRGGSVALLVAIALALIAGRHAASASWSGGGGRRGAATPGARARATGRRTGPAGRAFNRWPPSCARLEALSANVTCASASWRTWRRCRAGGQGGAPDAREPCPALLEGEPAP
jgi:hypothetical protein